MFINHLAGDKSRTAYHTNATTRGDTTAASAATTAARTTTSRCGAFDRALPHHVAGYAVPQE